MAIRPAGPYSPYSVQVLDCDHIVRLGIYNLPGCKSALKLSNQEMMDGKKTKKLVYQQTRLESCTHVA